MAELYRILARQFPEHCEFWLSLCAEELEHASWIEYLYKKVEEGLLQFDERHTKTYTVDAFIDYLTRTIESVKDEQPSLARALSMTRDIERSLLEKRIFEFFSSGDREMIAVLKDLDAKLASHVGAVEAKVALLQPA